MSIKSMMPSNHVILCCPFSSWLQSFPGSGSFPVSKGLCIRWPNYWSFNFSSSPSNEYSGLISFGIDCFDLLAVQGTLKSLLQHHSWKAPILWCSAFFMAQLSHLCIRLHGLQHARLPCPSVSPRVFWNSCPSSRWCHLTILSSVTLFSSCPQCFPTSGSFLMSQLFASGG